MKLKKIFMTAALLAGCLTASAQQPQAAEQPFDKPAGEKPVCGMMPCKQAFAPHWYVQAQIGGQYTLGEVDFSDLLSGNFQAAVGYNFSPVWGLRLAIDSWQSKGGTDFSHYSNNLRNLGVQTWKYNFVAPTLDVTCDLTNWILGYKPDRVCNFGLLAGLGANFAWNNDEAGSVRNLVFATDATQDPAHQMSLYWSGTKTRFVGRFGAYLDFNVSRRVALGLELNCNATSDHYNSKKAGNADWYFNALAGVKVRLGKLAKKPHPGPIVIEKVVEKIVEKPADTVYVNPPAPDKREPLRRDIFFTIRGSEVSKTEMAKVEDVVAYLNKYPDSKVSVTGYADRGTGNPKLNIGYAQKRAQVINNLLVNRFGIDRARITVDSKGDFVQPYEQNDLNRVTICIAE